MTQKNKSGHPIFDLYTIEQLRQKTQLALSTLVKWENGSRDFGPFSRRNIALILGRPESELFNPPEPPPDTTQAP